MPLCCPYISSISDSWLALCLTDNAHTLFLSDFSIHMDTPTYPATARLPSLAAFFDLYIGTDSVAFPLSHHRLYSSGIIFSPFPFPHSVLIPSVTCNPLTMQSPFPPAPPPLLALRSRFYLSLQPQIHNIRLASAFSCHPQLLPFFSSCPVSLIWSQDHPIVLIWSFHLPSWSHPDCHFLPHLLYLLSTISSNLSFFGSFPCFQTCHYFPPPFFFLKKRKTSPTITQFLFSPSPPNPWAICLLPPSSFLEPLQIWLSLHAHHQDCRHRWSHCQSPGPLSIMLYLFCCNSSNVCSWNGWHGASSSKGTSSRFSRAWLCIHIGMCLQKSTSLFALDFFNCEITVAIM